MNITPHFTLGEFSSHDGVRYPDEWVEDRLVALCHVLERLREELGGAAITIVSGYRSPAHNAKVGGASASQHMQGRAADIVVKGCTPVEVHTAVLRLFTDKQIEIGGLGLYLGWVHVDIRPRPDSGHLAQWTGAGFGAEVA